MSRPWTPEELEFLRANWPAKNDIRLAQLLNRAPTAVHDQRIKMRLLNETYSKAHPRYTPQELEFLRQHYREMNLDELADALGRTWTSVRGKLRSLGLYAKPRGRGGARRICDRALYSVYDAKTGDPVAIARTAVECAKAMGVSVGSFYCVGTRFRAGRGKRWEVYRDDDIDEEE